MDDNEVMTKDFEIYLRYTQECTITVTAQSKEQALEHASDRFWNLFNYDSDVIYDKQVAIREAEDGFQFDVVDWENID